MLANLESNEKLLNSINEKSNTLLFSLSTNVCHTLFFFIANQYVHANNYEK